MKKFGTLVLTAAMAFALVACGSETTESAPESSVEESVATQESSVEASEAVVEESSTEESSTEEAVAVMSYADYAAAELDSEKTGLEVEMQRRISYANLELEATQLGMRKMEKSNVTYIRVNDKDKAVKADGSVVTAE